jgi:hypothetical protein
LVSGGLSALFVFTGVLIAVAKQGADMYGEQRSLTQFLLALGKNPYLSTMALILILTGLLAYKAIGTEATPMGKTTVIKFRQLSPYLIVSSSAILVFLGETYFYQNNLGSGVFSPFRYGLTSELAVVAAGGVLAMLALRLVSTGQTSKSSFPFGMSVLLLLRRKSLVN